MKTYDILLGTDENCVLQYLQNFPDHFLTEMEISRRAGGRHAFVDDAHWAHSPLNVLVELGILETDGEGKYRVKTGRMDSDHPIRKFMSPHFRSILEQSGRNFDLSAYTSH
jgi:hypothetical protein